jgi:hypothetical protein
MTRAHQYRPSDDRMGNAPWVHGPLQPMPTERRSLWQLWRDRRERETKHG